MKSKLTLRAGLEAGGAPVMWERVVRDALPTMKRLVPVGSQVLDVGYGDGLLTCYLCDKIGWRVTGLEVSIEAHRTALKYATQFGLSDLIDFRYCRPDETQKHSGEYDAVFIKTVLYNSSNLTEYAQWLEWILSILRPGGILVNFETGKGNALTQCYRKVRRRIYADLCLYTHQVEALYDERFEVIYRQYYGGLSQFFAPIPFLYYTTARLEEAISPRHADNAFVVSIIARKAKI